MVPTKYFVEPSMLILVPTAKAFAALLARPEESGLEVGVARARPKNASRAAEVNFMVILRESCDRERRVRRMSETVEAQNRPPR